MVDDDRTVFKFCALNALFPGQCRAEFFFQKHPYGIFFQHGQRVQLVIALRQRNVRCDSAGVFKAVEKSDFANGSLPKCALDNRRLFVRFPDCEHVGVFLLEAAKLRSGQHSLFAAALKRILFMRKTAAANARPCKQIHRSVQQHSAIFYPCCNALLQFRIRGKRIAVVCREHEHLVLICCLILENAAIYNVNVDLPVLQSLIPAQKIQPPVMIVLRVKRLCKRHRRREQHCCLCSFSHSEPQNNLFPPAVAFF